MLRARLAAQDGSLSFVPLSRVVATSREHLPVLLHGAASCSRFIIVSTMAASIRVPGASEHGAHQDAQDESNQGNDDNGLDIRVDHHVETP